MLSVKWPYPSRDLWQEELHVCEGNIVCLCGRQVGKSEEFAAKIAEKLLNNKGMKVLIVSGVERQASGLFNKVLRFIEGSFPKLVCKGKKKPLRTVFHLTNGSCLITEPVGLDGSGARQHTINGVVFEEMQLIPEEAFAAITPMLLTVKDGFIWMLGTAWAAEGYVYDRLSDPDFTVFRVDAEVVAEGRPEPQRSRMLSFLESERGRLSVAEYQQEYLAIPSTSVRQVFSDELISKCLVVSRPNRISSDRDFVCGVDPAGLGSDEGSISILDVSNPDCAVMVDHIITERLLTTQTTARVLALDNQYDFESIFVDDGGVGFGVFSELLDDYQTANRVVALNNAARPLDFRGEKTKKLLGENMIFNLLHLMEKDKIKLLADAEIRESLKSYKFEYDKKTKKLLISSNYNHPVQSIMRAAWFLQGKNLNYRVFSIKT